MKTFLLPVGLILFALLSLWPPWLYTTTGSGVNSHRNAGIHFILSPPPPQDSYSQSGIALDWARLAVEYASLAALLAAASLVGPAVLLLSRALPRKAWIVSFGIICFVAGAATQLILSEQRIQEIQHSINPQHSNLPDFGAR